MSSLSLEDCTPLTELMSPIEGIFPNIAVIFYFACSTEQLFSTMSLKLSFAQLKEE